MPRERRTPETDQRNFLRAAERACSAVAVLEDACWEVDTKAAGEMFRAREFMERALMFLRGEEPEL